MTDKYLEGPARRSLGFAETVTREFAFLEAIFGFQKARQSATFVRYQSKCLFLNVFHGRFSYSVGVELGRLSNPEVYYGLPSLIEGLVPGYKGRTEFQASSSKAVEVSVAEIAQTLRMHCGAALMGKDEALRRVEKASEERATKITLEASFGARIDRADQAWEAKNLRLAARLYEEAQLALDKTRIRRLNYLRSKLDIS